MLLIYLTVKDSSKKRPLVISPVNKTLNAVADMISNSSLDDSYATISSGPISPYFGDPYFGERLNLLILIFYPWAGPPPSKKHCNVYASPIKQDSIKSKQLVHVYISC